MDVIDEECILGMQFFCKTRFSPLNISINEQKSPHKISRYCKNLNINISLKLILLPLLLYLQYTCILKNPGAYTTSISLYIISKLNLTDTLSYQKNKISLNCIKLYVQVHSSLKYNFLPKDPKCSNSVPSGNSCKISIFFIVTISEVINICIYLHPLVRYLTEIDPYT